MSKINKKLIKEVAEDHNISQKFLEDLLKESAELSYNKTTPGERIEAYYKLLKFAVNNS